MSKRTLVRAFLLMAVTSTLAACSDVVTAPEDDAKAGDVLLVNDVAFAKGGNSGGGGGGKPGGDGGGKAAPNRVSFSEGIDSKDGSDLVDGTDKVSVAISDRLEFTTFDGNQKQQDRFVRGGGVVRTLCVDLRGVSVVASPDDLVDFIAAGGSVTTPFCVRARVHTRNESIGVTSLGPEGTATAGGKIVLQELSEVRGSWEWRLIFDTTHLADPDPPVPGGVDTVGEGLCIFRDTTDTWTFSNGCTVGTVVVDDDVELWRVLDGVFCPGSRDHDALLV